VSGTTPLGLGGSRRAFQAKVHFALGTIIQGLTVGALASEVAGFARGSPAAGTGWFLAASTLSLCLCILFWFRFMDNYHFGFRVVAMNARAHLFLAVLHMLLGLQQLVAIGLLDAPRPWFTMYVMLVGTMLVGARLSSLLLEPDGDDAARALDDEPGARGIFLSFTLSLVLLVAWYLWPGGAPSVLVPAAFGSAALGVFLVGLHSLRVFDRHQAFWGEGP
jgi:hypothetical protein